MNDMIPAWIAALHGHSFGIETLDKRAELRLTHRYNRAICSCGWVGSLELYEDYEPGLRWDWNDHVLYAIATTVRV